jgi:hypothetical protein
MLLPNYFKKVWLFHWFSSSVKKSNKLGHWTKCYKVFPSNPPELKELYMLQNTNSDSRDDDDDDANCSEKEAVD